MLHLPPSTCRTSVIIPFYNREKLLSASLESILSQTTEIDEIIAVDDGSTDNSAVVARTYPKVYYVRQENSGVAAARNLGLQQAHGRYITFLDSDDTWVPEKTRMQLAILEQNSGTDICFGHYRNYLDSIEEAPRWLGEKALQEIATSFSLCTAMIRREVFEKVGGFDESLETTEDIEWFFRARDSGVRIETLDTVLLERRVHADNISKKLTMDPLLRALQDSIRRRKEDRK